MTIGAAMVAVVVACAGCTSGPIASGTSATSTTSATAGPASTATPSSAPNSGVAGVTALMVQPLDKALVVHGSDGRDHVEYDLLAINGFSDPVTLSAVTVVAPDGRDLMTIEGAALTAATQTVFPAVPSAVIASSATAVVEVDLVLPAGEAVPATLTHRIGFTVPGVPGAALFAQTEITGIPVTVDRTPAVAIAPPLAGSGWLATSGCCTPNLHRDLRLPAGGSRIATAETFAVDWAKTKGDRVYDGTGATNDAFYGFGTDLLAVGDGTVVAARDGIAETDPSHPESAQSTESPGGNLVILKLADDVYAFYGHLQTGSVSVHVGDRVKTGQVIGRLGNTGPSTGPHLHFGLLDRPDVATGTSLPFVLARFTLRGMVDFPASTGDTLVITPASRALTSAYPLYGSIIDFG